MAFVEHRAGDETMNTHNEREENHPSHQLPAILRIIDYRDPEMERAWAELRRKRQLDGYTERCNVTGEDWEYMGTCIPADATRLIVHTFRHRCALGGSPRAVAAVKPIDRSHSLHADRSIYVNVPASAKYTKGARS